MDRYEADGRTAWVWRNNVRTQKHQFPTDAECSAWVAGMNPLKKTVKEPAKATVTVSGKGKKGAK